MKQFLASLAANFVTIAILTVGFFVVIIGFAAVLGSSPLPSVTKGSVLVIDMSQRLGDTPADGGKRSAIDDALMGDPGLSLRGAIRAVRAAAEDDNVSGILLRGNVTGTDYGSLREFRQAISDFREKSAKPVHAFLVNPVTADYYIASAASNITLDPFGTMFIPGISGEAVFLAGFLEKYGIGVQVTRVGRFKAAVEPFTRTGMSPENRLQTQRYVGAIWSEVKLAIAESRGMDSLAFQQLVDREGLLTPESALNAGLIDRVGYWDQVLDDLKTLTGKDSEGEPKKTSLLVNPNALPEVSLEDYAQVVAARNRSLGANQKVAIVYASGEIVDGEGTVGVIGGDALSRDIRAARNDDEVKAVVLRVNSPGGSAVASETIQRELALLSKKLPVVVSMGSVAASGGYWISTAASRIFVQPNTITGSIGVFGVVPNLQKLANRHGITFDTVKTGRYADLFSLTRPRNSAELAVIQRSVDAVYDAFIERVSNARGLSPDSVRSIAEGRVWSGDDAIRIGLADSVGGLEDAVRSAAAMASLTGDYDIVEYPRQKGAAEMITELLERKAPPLVSQPIDAGSLAPRIQNPKARATIENVLSELQAVMMFNDPRDSYARMPFQLIVR